jgi:hypothetical protein
MWAMAAPARQLSTAASAISLGVYGTAGFISFVGREPITAAVMMTFSMSTSLIYGFFIPIPPSHGVDRFEYRWIQRFSMRPTALNP